MSQLPTEVIFRVHGKLYPEVDEICKSLETSLGISVWRFYSAFGVHSCKTVCTPKQFLIVSLAFGDIDPIGTIEEFLQRERQS